MNNSSSNPVVQSLFALEAELKNLKHTSKAHATICVDSITQLMEAATYVKCHLYNPFEVPSLDYYHFDYHLPSNREIVITVRTKQQYRKKIQIEAI
jgi:hypothetical protein